LGGHRRGGGGAEGLERRAREIIAKYDKDGDHALNATELAAFFEVVHQRVEERHEQAGTATNTSSTTSAAGATGTTGIHHGTPLEHAQKAIEKFDKNGDGKLEARELAAMLMAVREREHRGQGGANRVAPSTTTPTTPPQS
jgi:Ca2+-binding EF-hand superfamily protein